MDEALKAFSSPSWWVLSVVIGLVLNILAPFINKAIESFWATHSKRKTEELASAAAVIRSKVERLAKRDTGLLEAKMEAMYWAIRIVLVLSIYLLLVQATFAIPLPYINVAAAPIALVGFLNITKFWKRWRESCHVHNLLTVKLREGGCD
mgnify:CR=1 FL=1